MSRTDKDMPWWVAADWWEPDHWRCEAEFNGGDRIEQGCVARSRVRRRSTGPRARWIRSRRHNSTGTRLALRAKAGGIELFSGG